MEAQTSAQQNDSCTLCHATNSLEISLIDRDGAPLRTVICQGCGLLYTSPRPSQEQLSSYYRDHYRLSYKGSYAPKRKHIIRAGRVALHRLQQIEDLIKPEISVLDVGAGGGEFAYLLQSRGCHVTGIEPNKGYCNHACQHYHVDIRNHMVQEMELPEERYQLITMYHVLEHIEDFPNTLIKLRRLLHPKGTLVVEVPNAEAVCQNPGNKYHAAHIYNFSPKTLAMAGQKVGLAPESIQTSQDGGNLLIRFRRLDSVPNVAGLIDGNCTDLYQQLVKHTNWSHYLSRYPYLRPWGKIQQAIYESWLLMNQQGKDERTLLDRLFQR